MKSFGFEYCELKSNGDIFCNSDIKLIIHNPEESRANKPEQETISIHIQATYLKNGKIFMDMQRSNTSLSTGV
jgi:hypothetical protein